MDYELQNIFVNFIKDAFVVSYHGKSGVTKRCKSNLEKTGSEKMNLHIPAVLTPYLVQRTGNLSQAAGFNGFHQFGKDIAAGERRFLQSCQGFGGCFGSWSLTVVLADESMPRVYRLASKSPRSRP